MGGQKPLQDGTRRSPGYFVGNTELFKGTFSNVNGQRTSINQEVDPEGFLQATAYVRAL